MTIDAVALTAAADALAGLFDHVSIHTGDPGAGAANELSGGGYARMAIAFDAASGGVAAMSAEISTPVPACAPTWLAFWNGATRVAKVPVTVDPFPGPGTFRMKVSPTNTTIQVT